MTSDANVTKSDETYPVESAETVQTYTIYSRDGWRVIRFKNEQKHQKRLGSATQHVSKSVTGSSLDRRAHARLWLFYRFSQLLTIFLQFLQSMAPSVACSGGATRGVRWRELVCSFLSATSRLIGRLSYNRLHDGHRRHVFWHKQIEGNKYTICEFTLILPFFDFDVLSRYVPRAEFV